MRLRVFDEEQFVTIDFGRWLIPQIQSKIISLIDRSKLTSWDNYINESEELVKLYNKTPPTYNIILFISKNMTCKGVDGDISIEISNTALVPGFDRVKASTLAKLINYGTLDMQGYPIFTDAFNYFAQDIDEFVSLYYNF